MFELFILYKLSEIRDELREPKDFQTELIIFGLAAQIVVWPVSLYVWIKSVAKKKTLAPAITGPIVAFALIPDWTNYFLIGFFAMFLRTAILAQIILESEDA
jgi:hydrogenase-4 membrane subunit HyfE